MSGRADSAPQAQRKPTTASRSRVHNEPSRVTTDPTRRGTAHRSGAQEGPLELLTMSEAARRLRVHRDTLDRERLAGRLGYVSIRGRVFVTADQLDDYINKQRREPCP